MKDKKKKRRWGVFAAIIVLFALWMVLGRNSDEGRPMVDIAVSSRGSIEELIPAGGRIWPVDEVKISPDVSGEIVLLAVEEGQQVRKGDLLIKIRQDMYLSVVERAQAALGAARSQARIQEAQFAKVAAQWNRTDGLFKSGAVSGQEWEAARADYEIASAQLEAGRCNVASAEAELEEARSQLAKTVVYAPMDGTVSRLNVKQGERVVGTSQMAGTEMLRIADLSQMEVLVSVGETDIVKIREGAEVRVELEAFRDTSFSAYVTQIAPSARNLNQSNEQVTEFQVRVRIRDKGDFRPGMSSTVSISSSSKNDILMVPLQAVTIRSGHECVFVYDRQKEKVREVRVQTGIQDLNFIEVVKGLDIEGIELVTGPYNTLSKELEDGALVRTRDK